MMRDSDIRYCPRCKGDLEWRAVHYAGIEHPVCRECDFVVWQNPKPTVEALIWRDGPSGAEVLLGRREDNGLWDLPGNFLNNPDGIAQALVRECRREMDVLVEVGDILGAFEDTFLGKPIVSIVYACTLKNGTPRPANLIDDVRWFPLTAPPTDVAYDTVRRALAEMQERLRSGNRHPR
jgi:ADP-ribose pyrophosphatase YjhB (NUDIX family)